MQQSVVIPVGLVDEDTLLEFVEGLKKITLADIKIENQYVLTSSYPSVIAGLQSLIGEGNGNGHKPVQEKKPAPKPKAAAKPKVNSAWKTWRVFGPNGEELMKLSKGEVSAHLKTGNFEPGTLIVHPKHGKMRVAGENGRRQELWPLKEEAGE